MTYEYICTACAHQWEADQSIKDAPLKACPKCRKQTAKRQVSGGTGFVLKGGGWYADLYSSSKGGEAKRSDSDSSTSSDSSSTAASTTSSDSSSAPSTESTSTVKADTSTSKPKKAKTSKAAE